jgi:hypothetical protein
MKKDNDLIIILICCFLICLGWISITTIVQSFICPDMTEMRLLFRTFHSFILDFDKCN